MELTPESIAEREQMRWEHMVARPSRLPMNSRLTHRFETFKVDDGNREAKIAAADFLAGKITPPLLLLVGPKGVGKTHLAYAVAWEDIEGWDKVLYYQAEELLDELRNFEQGGYERRIQRIKEVPLLIIDDLGAQSDTNFGMAKLDMIVDYRYREALPLIATANTLDIPDRILDRFKAGKVVLVKGQSHRGRQANA